MGQFSPSKIAVFAGLMLITGCSSGDGAAPVDARVQPGAVQIATAAPSKDEQNETGEVTSGGAVTLTREGDGHFYVEANVNGAPVRMMVDTGATSVALTMEDAEALGISQSEEGFSQTGRGVGGEVAVMPISIDTLSVGAISHRDVPAVVVNSELQVSLLGQSWLSRVGNVSIQGDKMTLN
jgi:aspartyl protease family protein